MSFSADHRSLLMFLFVSAPEILFVWTVRCLVVLIFGKAGLSSVDFAMCRFDVGFRHCFTTILRSFVDRFDIGPETNKKAMKRHQYDIDKNIRPAENGVCQFIYSYGWVTMESTEVNSFLLVASFLLS